MSDAAVLGAGAAFVAALVSMAQKGLPGDMQELLVRGNPSLGIKPNLLIDAIDAYLAVLIPPEVEELAGRLERPAHIPQAKYGTASKFVMETVAQLRRERTEAATALHQEDDRG